MLWSAELLLSEAGTYNVGDHRASNQEVDGGRQHPATVNESYRLAKSTQVMPNPLQQGLQGVCVAGPAS